MDKRMKVTIIGLSAVVFIIIITIGISIIKKFTPTDEVMLLTDYYQVDEADVILILQDEVYEKRGLLIDGVIYIDYDTVIEKFNHRFYWDKNENILTYTTPTEILRAEAGKNSYSITMTLNTTEKKADYPIVKVFADDVYVALNYVEQYSDIVSRVYEKPNRVVIDYRWGDYLYTSVTKATQLRNKPNIKSPILAQLSEGTEVMFVDTEEAPRKGFCKVMTQEGIIGYMKSKNAKKSYYKTIDSDFQAPEYTAQTRSGKINLVFHQVFNKDAAGNLEELIKATKGVTVVSPTWFSISDNSGTITSLASHNYVEKAKALGLEVWALVDDFNTEVSMFDLLSKTSSRDHLSNSLIQAALDYKLNGINIDFEKIPSEAGIHYVQFLRELSVKCRNNGIVLSVDNYVPAPYNRYYDREEQGKIVDYIIVMAYDEYFAGSDVAGPVASIGFVKDAVKNTLEEVPKEKTIIAIPFYTRLWKETQDGEVTSESLSMTPALKVFTDNNLEPKWDDTYGSYYAEYEKDGAVYKMWQEEDKSIEEKMKVIYEAEVVGVAAWKLGLERESIWNVIIRYLN